jgi:transcription elongation factor Elf1
MGKDKGKVVQEVNQFGDFACPYCRVMFINPLDYELKAGVTNCQCCGKKFVVTEKAAKIASLNNRKYDKALDKVIKGIQAA